MYDPDPDPIYQKPYKIKMQTGEMVIPPIIPENSVTSGENPFIQLLYRFAKKQNRTVEDFVRHLTQEKKVLPNNKHSISVVKNFIEEMYDGDELGGLLIKRKGAYTAGVNIRTGRRVIKLNRGYNPFEYVIINASEHKGTISRGEIYGLLSFSGKGYQWARGDSTINYYIKKLLKEGCLDKFGKDWFRYKKYPERMV